MEAAAFVRLGVSPTTNFAYSQSKFSNKKSFPKSLIKATLSNPASPLLAKTIPVSPLPRVSPSSLQCETGFLIPNRNSADSHQEGTLTAMEYLTNILKSKVYDVAYNSPLQPTALQFSI